MHLTDAQDATCFSYEIRVLFFLSQYRTVSFAIAKQGYGFGKLFVGTQRILNSTRLEIVCCHDVAVHEVLQRSLAAVEVAPEIMLQFRLKSIELCLCSFVIALKLSEFLQRGQRFLCLGVIRKAESLSLRSNSLAGAMVGCLAM